MTLKEMIAFFKTRPNDIVRINPKENSNARLIIRFDDLNEALGTDYFIVPDNEKCSEIVNELILNDCDEEGTIVLADDIDTYGSGVSCFKVMEMPYNDILIPSLIKAEYQINWDIILKQTTLNVKEHESRKGYIVELPFNYMRYENNKIKVSVKKMNSKEYRITDNSYFNYENINIKQYFNNNSKLYNTILNLNSINEWNSLTIYSDKESLIENIFKLGGYILSLDTTVIVKRL